MKKMIFFFLSILFLYSCGGDDNNNSNDPIDDPVDEIENLVYSESVNGDLSNTNTAPSSITFAAGNNRVVAEQSSDNTDYFTFEVPEGYELSEIIVDDFDIADDGFIGIANGTTIEGETAADLLGGLVYGTSNIDSDILPAMGLLSGSTGFSGTLSTGNYTVWLNQTGSTSNVTLNFVISVADEPIEGIEDLVYDESVDGDLSNNNTTPSSITFVAGNNRIVTEQSSDNTDYFTFEVPEGYELSEIIVDDFDILDDAFIGIANGTTINGFTADELLGGLVYGVSHIDTNILPAIGLLAGTTGFSGALPAGEYSVWLNQTGSTSTVTLNFVISM